MNIENKHFQIRDNLKLYDSPVGMLPYEKKYLDRLNRILKY